MMTIEQRPKVTRRVIDQIVRQIEREANLRQAGRLLELEPGNGDVAREMFGKANRVREERIRLLEQYGLA
jgi:16S rRNA A1518/A1519 N6-dimethyltransferase RsmA/KsgA/DIM1 with predicted DNA glycosylase/AP lyase activity